MASISLFKARHLRLVERGERPEQVIRGFLEDLAAQAGRAALPIVLGSSARFSELVRLAGLEDSPLVLDDDSVSLAIALAEQGVDGVVYVGLEEEAAHFAAVAGRLRIRVVERINPDAGGHEQLIAQMLGAATGLEARTIREHPGFPAFLAGLEQLRRLAAVGA